MENNYTEIESNIDGVEVSIKGPTDKASEIFGRLSQANKSTVESIHDVVSKPEVLDLLGSVDDKDELIEKGLKIAGLDPKIGSLLGIFKMFRKKKERSRDTEELRPEPVKIVDTKDEGLLGLLDFKDHRFHVRAGGDEALKKSPVTISNVQFGRGGLTFDPPNKKSTFRNYAFDDNFELIAQETSSHDVSTPLRRAVEEKKKKAKYILVVDVGHEDAKKPVGRSLVTEVS